MDHHDTENSVSTRLMQEVGPAGLAVLHIEARKWLRQKFSMTPDQEASLSQQTMEELIALPGIGRKSANVIMRGIGCKAEGVIVDLHVLRVAPRLGIAGGTDPKKIEKQIMDVIDEKDWGEIGMAISFLGRETCRPTNPHCDKCVVSKSCAYFKTL